MKLLRCYVQNYGKLHEFSYDFNNGLNIILQENGWGKSTFASFIKSMLFGLPSTTKHDLDQNERAKYTPWQGGSFGGWLEFTLDGLPYRVERTFGETKSKDKVKFYDLKTNQEIEDENFVENKLGINADTFMRSTFVEQGVFSTASNESIKARLGKLLQNDSNFELSAVDKKLLEKQTSYRLLKGKGGKIYNLEMEQVDARQKIAEASAAAQEIKVLSQKMTEINTQSEIIEQQIKVLRETQDRINEQKAKQGMREYYQNLVQDYEKAKQKHAEILQSFGATPPTKDDLIRLDEIQRKYEQLRLKLETFETNSQSQKMAELKGYFAVGVPTDEELTHASDLLKRLRSMPDEDGIKAINQKPKSTKPSGIIAAALGGIILVLAVIFGFVQSRLIIGIAGLVVGLVAIGVGLYHILKKPENLINVVGYYPVGERNDLIERLERFVTKYGEDASHFEDAIYNIRYKKQQLAELQQNGEQIAEQKDELIKEVQKNHDVLTEYYATYFDKTDDFTQCYHDLTGKCRELAFASKDIEDKQKKIEEFRDKQQIPEDEESNASVNTDTDVLRKQIVEQESRKDEFAEQQNKIKSQIYSLSRSADTLEFYTNKVAELDEQLAEANERWEIIKLTREMLLEAKDNLTSKYLAPLCGAFGEFSDKLLGEKFDGVSIDTDLNVLIETQGAKKDTKYFSQGIRDVIELCLRLALVKVLFDGDMPPLILDDPFYNLDDKKMKNAMELVHELSSEVQVVYLACHSSRA